MKRARPVILSDAEQMQVKSWISESSSRPRLAIRGRIILMAAEGMLNRDIARELGISRPTVQLWRDRFSDAGLEGLKKEAPRPGRTPKIQAAKVRDVVHATLHSSPSDAFQWSARSLAKVQGVSESSVRRIWRQYNLHQQPDADSGEERQQHILERLYDIVGLLLDPPAKALVVYIDDADVLLAQERLPEEPQVQQEDGWKLLPPADEHPAAIDGGAAGKGRRTTRQKAYLGIFRKIFSDRPAGTDLYVIVEDQKVLRHPKVQSWIKRHPRFHVKMLPAGGALLDPAGVQPLLPVGGESAHRARRPVSALTDAIKDYLTAHNHDPRVRLWTVYAEARPVTADAGPKGRMVL